MSQAIPIVLLYAYWHQRRRAELTSHEQNVANIEAIHIRHLQHAPDSFLSQCRLTPTFPPPIVRFSNQAHIMLATDEEEFRRATYLSVAEFTLFHTYLHHKLLSSHNHHPSTSEHLHNMPTELTTADQLLLWLFHLCGDRTSQLIMHFQGLQPSTIFRYLDHVSWCINEALDECIAWPTASEREALYGMMSVHEHAVAVLDGTHCEVQAPTHLDNLHYSGYKHKHTQNYLCYVDYMGMVIKVEGPWAGRPNDRACYNISDFKRNQSNFLTGDEQVLADGGFIGGPGLLVPIHADTYDQPGLDEQARHGMMKYNEEFTANRLIVEDVFGWLKARACIFSQPWARKLDKQGALFKAACRLHNFARLIRIDYALHRYDSERMQSE